MPKPSLEVTRRRATGEIDKLFDALHLSANSDTRLRSHIAEMALIRLASILEISIAEISYKICCGASYLDGTEPKIFEKYRSMAAARTAMLGKDRKKMRQSLKWNRSKEIRDSVCFVIDKSDAFIKTTENHGATISEIFTVRNYAAHRSQSSRTHYKKVVKNIYGTDRLIPLSNFLLSSKLVSKPNIDRYLASSNALIKSYVKYDK